MAKEKAGPTASAGAPRRDDWARVSKPTGLDCESPGQQVCILRKLLYTGAAMNRPGRWISLFPILALVPRLGLVVLAADRQEVTPETRAALLWSSSAALAVLVGLAEVYVGIAVVSRRHAGLASLWVAITVLLNALIIPLSVSGLEAVPVWEILGSRGLQVAWGTGLGLLSTLCVCGCLWADVVREGSGLPETYEAHLLSRLAEEEARRAALEADCAALRVEAERARDSAPAVVAPVPTHAACGICGYWHPVQRKVAGHVTQCRRRAAREGTPASPEPASGAEESPA